MNRQTDPQPTGELASVSLPLAGKGGQANPNFQGQRVRESLDRDQVGIAVALLREMLPADQGILLQRISRVERRLPVALLPQRELSDILDEAPTPAAAAIVRELPPDRAV